MLPAIAKLESALFDRPLTGTALQTLFDGVAFTGFACLTEAGGVEAYVIAHQTADEVEILSLGTALSARRLGYATRVLAKVLTSAVNAGAEQVVLEVAIDNHAAIHLYEKNGFVRVGRRPNYYRRDDHWCDAVIMRCVPIAPFP
jgi:[ribosomal protein S18]-alanine N-acetyltransferase